MDISVETLIKGKWTIPVTVGIIAFGGGLGTGYILGKKRNPEVVYRHIIDKDEYDKALDPESWRVDPETELSSPSFTGVTLIKDVPTGDNRRDYSEIIKEQGYSPVTEDDPDDEMEEEIELERKNVFAEAGGSVDEWNYADEMGQRGSRDPYVIHQDEFINSESDFPQETLTYYAGDDVIVGQDDKKIGSYKNLLGANLKFGHGTVDPNTVYIRNPGIQYEWEVLRHEGSYETEVLALDIEEDYEEADMKHSKIRRFRDD